MSGRKNFCIYFEGISLVYVSSCQMQRLKKMDKNHRWHFSVFLQDTVIIKISILVDQVVIFTSFIMSIIFGISFLEQTVILVEINKKMRFDKTVFCRLPPEGITFFTHLKSKSLNLSLANI